METLMNDKAISESESDFTSDCESDFDSDVSDIDGKSDTSDNEAENTKVKKAKKAKSTVVKKKGPGRPRKTPKKEPIARKGIIKTPENSDSLVEVLYDQPLVMKKIFQFFKAIATPHIQILFRPTDIVFYAVDHHKKSRVRIKIDATKLNNYYCKDIVDVGIAAKEMELILNKVDKDYSSIVLLNSIDGDRKHLVLVLENSMQIAEAHRIQLVGHYNKMETENEFIDENYTIKFEYPSKYFKKTISDIKTMSPQLSIIQEDNHSPIVFEYTASNNRIHSKHTVKNSARIKLTSTLQEDETFRVDIRVDNLKPIASSQIADDIAIFVDENKAFMTKTYIDNKTVEIKTLTEIVTTNHG